MNQSSTWNTSIIFLFFYPFRISKWRDFPMIREILGKVVGADRVVGTHLENIKLF